MLSKMKKILLGVGNELLGDDGIGPWIAERINGKGSWKGINAGTVPENFSSLLKREKPDILVMVDATEMNLPAGEFRIVPRSLIPKLTYFSTHTLSLAFLIDALKDDIKNIIFIGIQPKAIALGCPISKEVLFGARKLLDILISKDPLSEIISL